MARQDVRARSHHAAPLRRSHALFRPCCLSSGLIARLQLLLQLHHQPLWVARVRLLLILVVLACDYAAYKAVRYRYVLTKLVKNWDVLEFFFLEW